MSLTKLQQKLVHPGEFGPVGDVLKEVQVEIEALHQALAQFEEQLEALFQPPAPAPTSAPAPIQNTEDAVDKVPHVPMTF